MKVTIGEVRKLVRRVLEVNAWSNYVRDVNAPATDDREAITKMQLKTADGENELSGHLLDAEKLETDEEMWGPVPPKKDQVTFYSTTDPYANDWSPLPTGNFRR